MNKNEFLALLNTVLLERQIDLKQNEKEAELNQDIAAVKKFHRKVLALQDLIEAIFL